MKLIISLLIYITLISNSVAQQVDTLRFGFFGRVMIYKPQSVPHAFVLFVSGDGGWNSGVIDMAKHLVTQGAMVAGINIQHYFRSIRTQEVNCYYPAGDFEELSLTLQKKYHFAQYLKPVLVGYSSGATLVYGMLAQAPANTFKGAISLGFCPDIETNRTLCNGSGLTSHVLKEGEAYYLESTEKLSAPFFVLQGTEDQVCAFPATEKFMKGVAHGTLISLPHVGHGFSVSRNWMPQFYQAFQSVLQEPSYAEKKAVENPLLQSQHIQPYPGDLPLTLLPAAIRDTLPLAFFISGDGGWTSFDQTLGEQFALKGIPVVGMDAQKYFWNGKTPEQTASEVSQAIMHYMKVLNKKSFILIGYSFGACVVPFIANKFSESLKENLKGVFCISPDETADFEIHIADMLKLNTKEKYNVLEEVKTIRALNPVCIFGADEDVSLRTHFSETKVKTLILPGNHHFNNDYSAICLSIIRCLRTEYL